MLFSSVLQELQKNIFLYFFQIEKQKGPLFECYLKKKKIRKVE